MSNLHRDAADMGQKQVSGITVTLLVSGCGGVATSDEFVSGGDQVIETHAGDLEVLSRAGERLAHYRGGTWVTWRRLAE